MTHQIPLWARDGSVRAYALIDAGDLPLVEGFRWHRNNYGYAAVAVGRRTVLMHRHLFGLQHGDRQEVDHISLDRLDNRRGNLRLASHAQNGQNLRSRGGSSRYRGVTWDKSRKKWKAGAVLGGRMHHGGYFDDEDDAGAAAQSLRAQLMPFAMPDPLLALHSRTVSTPPTSIRPRPSDEEIAA